MLIMDLINHLKTITYTYYPNAFPPTSVDDCAVVRFKGGAISRGVSRPSWQVLIRASNPANAEAKAWQIYNFMHLKRDFDVGETHVILCNAQQSTPIYIGTDENGRFLYSVNFTSITEVL